MLSCEEETEVDPPCNGFVASTLTLFCVRDTLGAGNSDKTTEVGDIFGVNIQSYFQIDNGFEISAIQEFGQR